MSDCACACECACVCVSVRDSLVDFNLSRHLMSRGEKGDVVVTL